MFLIDLAGSETAADSQFHDKSRIQESSQGCIRSRHICPHSLQAIKAQSFVERCI